MADSTQDIFAQAGLLSSAVAAPPPGKPSSSLSSSSSPSSSSSSWSKMPPRPRRPPPPPAAAAAAGARPKAPPTQPSRGAGGDGSLSAQPQPTSKTAALAPGGSSYYGSGGGSHYGRSEAAPSSGGSGGDNGGPASYGSGGGGASVAGSGSGTQEDWFGGGGGGVSRAGAGAGAGAGADPWAAAPSPAPAPLFYGAPPAAAAAGRPSDPFGSYSSGGGGGGGGTAASDQPPGDQSWQERAAQPAIMTHQHQHFGASFLSDGMLDKDAASGPIGSGAIGSSYSTAAPMSSCGDDDYDNEPPLMEELGINLDHIAAKSKAVILPFTKYASDRLDAQLMDDTDLAGPLCFALLLGAEMMLAGKLNFGYIYGFGLFGTLALSLVMNLMSPADAISVWTVLSVLGYALLPVNVLACVNAVPFLRIRNLGPVGMIMASATVGWCTMASTRLFERGCDMRDQRYLIAYPTALLYSAFVIITIF